MLKTAKQYLKYKLSVLPAILKQKRPCIGAWKEYQKRLSTESELAVWFSDKRPGVDFNERGDRESLLILQLLSRSFATYLFKIILYLLPYFDHCDSSVFIERKSAVLLTKEPNCPIDAEISGTYK